MSHFDCLWSKLSGSINSAFYGGEITKDQANYLRTYLYVETQDDFGWSILQHVLEISLKFMAESMAIESTSG